MAVASAWGNVPLGLPTAPIVIGPKDLHRPAILRLVQRAYASGQTVGLTRDSRANDLQFAAILGHPDPSVPASAAVRADLVAFRAVRVGGKLVQDETSVILPCQSGAGLGVPPQVGNLEADSVELEALKSIIAATPTIAHPPTGSLSSLLDLTSPSSG